MAAPARPSRTHLSGSPAQFACFGASSPLPDPVLLNQPIHALALPKPPSKTLLTPCLWWISLSVPLPPPARDTPPPLLRISYLHFRASCLKEASGRGHMQNKKGGLRKPPFNPITGGTCALPVRENVYTTVTTCCTAYFRTANSFLTVNVRPKFPS